jgi:outer membrane lipoprotein-sorting protein
MSKLLCLLLCLVPLVVLAQDAEEILRHADQIRVPAQSFLWDVTITTHEGARPPVVNSFEVYVKSVDKSFVKFVAPARTVGQSLLYLNRDLWISLPDAGKPVRMPLAQRLVGQVSNGDLARTNYADDYTPTLAGREPVEGVETYVLALAAKTREVTYAAIKYWVATETFHPVKAEFYAGTGTLLKTGSFEAYTELAGRLRPARLTFVDAVRKDCKSTLAFSNLRVRELPDKYFDKSYMKTLD